MNGPRGTTRLPGRTNLLANGSFEWGPTGSMDEWQPFGVNYRDFDVFTIVPGGSDGLWSYAGTNRYYAGACDDTSRPCIAPEAGITTSTGIPVESGRTYVLSADFRLLAGSGTIIGRLHGFDASGKDLGSIIAFQDAATADWHRYAGTVNLTGPLATAVSVQPEIVIVSPDAADFLADAIQLEPDAQTPFSEGFARTFVSVDVRTGNNATPDRSWTRWRRATPAIPTSLSGRRYAQYRIEMRRTTTDVPSPEVATVTLSLRTPAIQTWLVDGHDMHRSSFQFGDADLLTPTVAWKVRTGGVASNQKTVNLAAGPASVFAEGGRIRAVRLSDGSTAWISPYLQSWVTVVGIADVDGDGHPEIIADAGPRLTFVVLDGETGVVKYHFENGWIHAFDCATHAITDVTGDGIADLVVTAADGLAWYTYMFDFTHAIAGQTAVAPAWTVVHPSLDNHATVAGDLASDGKKEVVVFDPNVIRVIDGASGLVLAEMPHPGVYCESEELRIVQLQPGGPPVLLANSWNERPIGGGNVWAMSYTGGHLQLLWAVTDSSNWTFGGTQTAPHVISTDYDWNGDGISDVVFTNRSTDGTLNTYFFSGADGSLLAKLPNQRAGQVMKLSGDDAPHLLTTDQPTGALVLWRHSQSGFVREWDLSPTWWTITPIHGVPTLVARCGNELEAYQDAGGALTETRAVDVSNFAGVTASVIDGTSPQMLLASSDGVTTILDWDSLQPVSSFTIGNYGAPVWAPLYPSLKRLAFFDSQSQLLEIELPINGSPQVTRVDGALPSPLYTPSGSRAEQAVTDDGAALRRVDLDGTLLWSVNRIAIPFGYGDFNGQGRLDIFSLDIAARTYVAFNGDTGDVLWTRSFSAYFPDILAAADLNGDGHDDIVAIFGCTISGFDGTVFRCYGRHEDQRSFIANLEEDAEPEVIGAAGGYAFIVNGRDGRLLWRLPLSRDGYETTGILPAFIDADGDGVDDVAIPNASGRLRILRGQDGRVLHDIILSGGAITTDPTAGIGLTSAVATHINGVPAVIVGSGDGWIYAINASDGTLLMTYEIGYPIARVILADVDGDGKSDIIVSSTDGYLRALVPGHPRL